MRWYTADFDRLSWRDVPVHGFRVVEDADGGAALQFDIDFILARTSGDSDGEVAGFRVAQAMLRFHEVAALRFSLDYVACSADMSVFSIGAITRESMRDDVEGGVGGGAEIDADDDLGEERDDHGPWRWRIDIDWPEGVLTFEASGFTQWLVGEEIAQSTPVLPAALRL